MIRRMEVGEFAPSEARLAELMQGMTA